MTDILTFCYPRQHQHCLFSPFYQIFAKFLEASQRQQTGGGSGSGCLSTKLDPKQTLLKLFRYESTARGWMKTLFKDMSKGWRRKIKKMITENLKGFLFTLNELSSNNSTNQKHIEDNPYMNNVIKTKLMLAVFYWQLTNQNLFFITCCLKNLRFV